MDYMCPICGYEGLAESAYDLAGCASFEICPFCGNQYGYHDSKLTHRDLRARWMTGGFKWHSAVISHPEGWNPERQLAEAAFV